jgi:transposase
LRNGGFLAHRNRQESEDEPEVLRPAAAKPPAEEVVRDIRRATRKHHSAEDKIHIVLEGLRGEESIAALCRREAIAESLYYAWSKEFLEPGKRRLAGDTARAATTEEVQFPPDEGGADVVPVGTMGDAISLSVRSRKAAMP